MNLSPNERFALKRRIKRLENDLAFQTWKASRMAFMALGFGALALILALVHYVNHHHQP